MTADHHDAVPRWLVRGAWMALAVVVVGGAALAVVLASGAADPPRAGTHVYTVPPFTESRTFTLPPPPFTLEVTGVFPPGATFDSRIRLEFLGADGSVQYAIHVYPDGYFSLPPFLPDSVSFIHLRPERNHIYLNIESGGAATLRLNSEIAWRGKLNAAQSARISGDNPPGREAIRFEGFTLYTP